MKNADETPEIVIKKNYDLEPALVFAGAVIVVLIIIYIATRRGRTISLVEVLPMIEGI